MSVLSLIPLWSEEVLYKISIIFNLLKLYSLFSQCNQEAKIDAGSLVFSFLPWDEIQALVNQYADKVGESSLCQGAPNKRPDFMDLGG